MKPIFGKTLFRKSVLSYLLILVLLLGFGLVGYIRANTLLEKETMQYNLTILAQKQMEIDSRLEEITKLVSNVSLNSRVSNFVYASPSIGKYYYYYMYLALSEMSSSALTNDFVHEMYIYHRRGDEILASAGVYDLRNFFQQFADPGSPVYGGWLEMIRGTYRFQRLMPAQVIYAGTDKEMQILTLLSSLPHVPLGKESNATLIIMIDANRLLDILGRNLPTAQSAVFLLDEAGECLLSYGRDALADTGLLMSDTVGSFTVELDGERTIVASVASAHSGLRYVSISPEALLMRPVEQARLFSIYFIGVTLLMGLLLILVLAYINYRPIHKTLHTIQTQVPGMQEDSSAAIRDEMGFIQTIVQHTLLENENMRRDFQEHLPVLQSDTLKQLLHGEFASPGEAHSALAQLGVSFQHRAFYVVYISIDHEAQVEAWGDNRNLVRFVITNVAEELFGGGGRPYVLSIAANSLCVIVNVADPQTDAGEGALKGLCARLLDTLRVKCSLSVTIGVSACLDGIENLHTAMIQAQQAQEYCLYHTSSNYRLFQEINSRTAYYPFSIELEQQLLGNIKMGNYKTVDKLLDQIYATHQMTVGASLEIIRCVFFDLMGTALKLLSALDIDYCQVFGQEDPFERLYACRNISTMQQTIRMLFRRLCDHFNSGRTSRNDRLRDSLLAYIDAHYSDPDLSLASVSEVFGITPSYISHFLKQNASDSFVQLLRMRRIAQAEHLLAQSHMTLDEIARDIGYTSSLIFARNFKKVHGMAPGQYRDSHGEDKAR